MDPSRNNQLWREVIVVLPVITVVISKIKRFFQLRRLMLDIEVAAQQGDLLVFKDNS
jgi:hypothetical protein